ncbi:MAG: adenylate kinase, partial [bacterium]
IQLDAINWLPNWVERPNSEFRVLVQSAVMADKWVVDGNYSRTRDIVWSRATTLIWLNYSFPVVVYRALSRTLIRIFSKEELYSGNRETFSKAFLSKDSILLWVLKTYFRRRREYLQLLKNVSREKLQILILTSPKETNLFISYLGHS